MARRWRGVIMVEGRATGDGRYIEANALRWENLPLPFMWAPVGGGHDDRVIVGSIEGVTRDGGMIRGEGLLFTGVVAEADQVVPLVESKVLGVSAELDDVTEVMQPIDADGNPVGEPEPSMGILIGAADDPLPELPEDVAPGEPDPNLPEIVDTQLRVQDARVRAACIVDVPAFIECVLELGEEVPNDTPAVVAALAAAAAFQEGETPTGAMVAFLPATPDDVVVDGGDTADQLHVTIGYYPDGATMPDADRQTLTDAVTGWIANSTDTTFDAAVSGWGMIGEDDPPAGVLFLEAGQFEDLRTLLEGTSPAPGGGHPHFTPHITLGYGLPPDTLAAAKAATPTVTIGAVRMAFGADVTDLPLSGGDQTPAPGDPGDPTTPPGPPQAPQDASSHTAAVVAGACCVACQQGKSCEDAETFPVPAAAAAEAKRFIGWRRAGVPGGTVVALARANDLTAPGARLSYVQVRRLYLSLLRLDGRRGGPDWTGGSKGYPSPNRVTWAANGGDTALEWAKKIVERFEGPVVTYAMTAGASDHRPNVAWFRDPKLTGPTPLTVTADGRVFGHLAPWDSCHMSVQGYCQTPPRSRTGYAYFHQSPPILMSDGSRLRCGKITLGVTHADRRLGRMAAVTHYENGLVAADVVAGEDRYGIWVAGEVRPGLAPGRRLHLERTAVSGDWRDVPGYGLELMAALCVNNPGFPVVQALVAGGAPRSLIVAGVVEQDRADRRHQQRRHPTRRHHPQLDGAAEALAASIGRDKLSLVAAMTEEVHGGV